MTMYQEQEIARFQKRRAAEAVQLAMEARWDEAAQANRDIIAMQPNDPHAYNRLGKALLELGRYAEARDAYARALELDAVNAIAKKNLARLAALGEEGAAPGEGAKLAPHLFIAETGRSGQADVLNAAQAVIMRLTPGDQVELRREEAGLGVYTMRGEKVGDVDPRVGLRLATLMEGGNMYAAAVVSADQDQCRIIIREVYQHPSQMGRPSFPAAGAPAESFRPYTRERLVRVDESADELEEEAEDWEDREGSPEETLTGSVRLGGIDADLDDTDSSEDNEFEE